MSNQRGLLITEFARRCRLPVSTLRYYDKLGLLRPADVDVHNGYRRYAVDQVHTAILIARLRAAGMPPDAIGAVLRGGEAAAAALADQRARLREEIRQRTDALSALADLTAVPAALPQRVELAAATVLVGPLRTTPAETGDPLSSAVTRGIVALRAGLRRRGVEPTGWGALLPLDPADEVCGEVFARVEEAPADGDARTLPAGPAVRVHGFTTADQLGYAYAAALAEIERLGGTPAGPVIEEYALPEAPGARTAVRLTVRMN